MAEDSHTFSCVVVLLSLSLGLVHGQYKQIDLTDGNVSCNMSSVYTGSDGVSLDCHGAINGNTDTTWYNKDSNTANCVFTKKGYYPPTYWLVNMQTPRNVHKITIYYVKYQGGDYTNSIRNVKVSVDGKQVFKYSDRTEDIKNPVHITDNLPLAGQIIKIERTTKFYDTSYLPLCEVQAWECAKNRYGQACAHNCSVNCKDNGGDRTCDPLNGTCIQGCKPLGGMFASGTCTDCKAGWYGEQCNVECNRNCGAVNGARPCAQDTGNCTAGCETRWYGATCTIPCSDHCSNNTCEQDGGGCTQGCDVGYYGTNCTMECNQTCDGGCSQDNGKCTKCKPGYWGKYCEQVCNPGCHNGTCVMQDGSCSCAPGWKSPDCAVCDDSHYGERCSGTCGNCTGGLPCNQTTGHCASCNMGWAPPLCQQPCQGKTYGQDCSSQCGNCKAKATCDPVDGHCPDGCDPGYLGEQCDKECHPGYYGQDCRETCGNCDGHAICDHVTGTCHDGCYGNFSGDLCKDCQAGQWGDNCTEECGHCAGDGSCNMTTAFCLDGCIPGWNGSVCLEQVAVPPDDGYRNIGGVVAGAVVAVVVVVVVVALLVLRRRRRAKSGNDSLSSDTNILQNTPDEGKRHPDKSSDEANLCYTNALAITERETPASDDSHLYGNVNRNISNGATTTASHEAENLYGNVPFSGVPESQEKPQTKPRKAKKEDKKKKKAADQRAHKYENITLSEDGVEFATEPEPMKQATQQCSSEAGRDVTPLPGGGEGMKRDDSLENLIQEEDGVCRSENLYSSYQIHTPTPDFDPFQQYLLDCLASGKLANQFAELPKGLKHPCNVGMTAENNRKNRFKKLCAYDYNRVILHWPEGDDTSDYINASYIKGCDREREYIATQGPRSHTTGDLWWMVWQEGITQIVMLTNLKEDGKDKCEEYWPASGKSQTYGHVTVRGVEDQQRADFVVRSFALITQESSDERHVTQYHYKAWPDHGVPLAASIVDFWRYAKARATSDVPLLVHCSAGVGRTGTYIALDIALNLKSRGRDVNINDIVKKLRNERSMMVQSEVQYMFLHEAILEAHTSRATRISMDQFDVIFPDTIDVNTENSRIDAEFQILEEMGEFSEEPQHTVSTATENVDKNRNLDTLPDDEHLAYLSLPLLGRNNYINTVRMSSFRQRNGLLLTQLPLPDTVVDLWRLVDGFCVRTIVSISSPDEEKTVQNSCQYWPRTVSDVLTSGLYTISLTSLSVISDHISSYQLTCQSKMEEQPQSVEVLHYTGWSEEVPNDTLSLLRFVDKVKVVMSGDVIAPIIIQCIDGAARSGLFCALCDEISRVTYDGEVDVYLTARKVQRVRPQAVATKAQYRYLYRAVQEYGRHLSVYGNADFKKS